MNTDRGDIRELRRRCVAKEATMRPLTVNGSVGVCRVHTPFVPDEQFPVPPDALTVRPPLIRLGTTEDVAGVKLLESRYFVGNLTPAQRENGFISIIQPEGWFARIAKSGGLHVAVDGSDAVVGFIAIGPPLRMAQTPLSPIVEQMVMLADTVKYRGRHISSYKYALRGPVCIDERFRGAGLYDSFNAATKAAYSHIYDIGVLFVSARNPRSRRTTTTKLKATPLASFNIGEESYDYLAYELGDFEAISPN